MIGTPSICTAAAKEPTSRQSLDIRLPLHLGMRSLGTYVYYVVQWNGTVSRLAFALVSPTACTTNLPCQEQTLQLCRISFVVSTISQWNGIIQHKLRYEMEISTEVESWSGMTSSSRSTCSESNDHAIHTDVAGSCSLSLLLLRARHPWKHVQRHHLLPGRRSHLPHAGPRPGPGRSSNGGTPPS